MCLVDLDLLLYFYFVSKNEDALDMVRLTLVKMYEGGKFLLFLVRKIL